MCRIDRCFNFLFKFTATLSKLRSKSKRGSFGTYEFGGSISRRIFSIISHWNRCQICCGCQQSKLWIWGKYFSLISIIFVEDETSDQPTIHLWGSFSLNFCIKIISVWTTLQLFCTFIPHICHIHWMGSRSTWVLKSFLFLLQWCRPHPLHPSPPQTHPPRSRHRRYLPPHERSKSQWWSWCSYMFHIGYRIAFLQYRRKFWWIAIIFAICGGFSSANLCESPIFSPYKVIYLLFELSWLLVPSILVISCVIYL